MLQAAFFSKRTSYGYRISHLFTSSLPDQPDEKEIPAAVLALISTAVRLGPQPVIDMVITFV